MRLKTLIYGCHGEPYRINGKTLRFAVGTRPVHIKYRNSPSSNVCNDAKQVELLAKYLNEGDCAIDIGAHAGQYSVLMSAFTGHTGHVYSFEPDPYAREKFKRNFDLNPTLKAPVLESLACSDTSGETILFSKGGNSQSSLARSAVEFDATKAETISIRTTTLDEYINKHLKQLPKWIKIDTEGAEIKVLKGSKQLLGSKARIICELHPYAWEEFGNTFQELQDYVQSANRKMVLLSSGQELVGSPQYCTVLLEHK